MPTSTVKVCFEYAATQADELSLKVGELITEVDTSVEGGWWEGVNSSGQRGVFPDNFVEEIKTAPPPAVPPVPKAVPPPANGGKQCKCTFAYDAQNSDELSLSIGDIVDITSQAEEGWWEGTLNGKSGVFPSNFVEELAPRGKAGAPPVPPPADGGASGVQPKKVEKVGLGNIFGDSGMPKLRKTGTFSGTKPEFLAKKSQESAPAPPPPAAAAQVDLSNVKLVKVEFDYTAENNDEITLKKGQFIRVIKAEEGGWWEGEVVEAGGVVGIKGWFPDNFVNDASASEKEEILGGKSSAPPPARPSGAAKPPPPASTPKPAASKPPPPPSNRASVPPPASPSAAPPIKKKAPTISIKKKPPVLNRNKPSIVGKPPKTPAAAPAAAPVVPASPAHTAAKPPVTNLAPVSAAASGASADAVAEATRVAKEALALAKSIQEQMEAFKAEKTEEVTKLKKLVSVLTTDIDDEKAARTKMQIEVDRLRKLSEL
eukprot:m.522719 g.522719  ORF g.522719 m.522719 type:complete len:486 (+) comp21969_c0_seq1:109-1566(+)